MIKAGGAGHESWPPAGYRCCIIAGGRLHKWKRPNLDLPEAKDARKRLAGLKQ